MNSADVASPSDLLPEAFFEYQDKSVQRALRFGGHEPNVLSRAMDMAIRRRTGKGVGAEGLQVVGNLQLTDQSSEARTHRDGGARGSTDEVAGADQVRALEDSQVDEGAITAVASAEAPVNPFWSTRAQDEMRLQAARPQELDFLGQVGVRPSGSSTTSTELRAAEPSAAGCGRAAGSHWTPCGLRSDDATDHCWSWFGG